MTTIVLADCHALSFPHKLDLASWKESGAEIREANCHTEEDLIRECREAAVVVYFGNNLPFTDRVLESLSRCLLIQRVAVGYDSVDLAAATRRGILVANSAGYCNEDVANHALALMLACHQQLSVYQHNLRNGHWGKYADPPIDRLSRQVLGIIGLGRIGRTFCVRARPLVERVLAYDPYITPETAQQAGAELVDWSQLLSQSDLISLHCPLTEETRGMIDAEALSQMKPTVCLVNTSRGPVVDLDALTDALQNGRLRSAGLDVFPAEPPTEPFGPIFSLPNVIATPHAAAASVQSLNDLWRIASESAAAVLKGQVPETVVNPQTTPRQIPPIRKATT